MKIVFFYYKHQIDISNIYYHLYKCKGMNKLNWKILSCRGPNRIPCSEFSTLSKVTRKQKNLVENALKKFIIYNISQVLSLTPPFEPYDPNSLLLKDYLFFFTSAPFLAFSQYLSLSLSLHLIPLFFLYLYLSFSLCILLCIFIIYLSEHWNQNSPSIKTTPFFSISNLPPFLLMVSLFPTCILRLIFSLDQQKDLKAPHYKQDPFLRTLNTKPDQHRHLATPNNKVGF